MFCGHTHQPQKETHKHKLTNLQIQIDKYTETQNKKISYQLFSGLKDKSPNSNKVQRRKQKYIHSQNIQIHRFTNRNSKIASICGPYFHDYFSSSSTLLLCCCCFQIKACLTPSESPNSTDLYL